MQRDPSARRQFLLAPRPLEALATWRRVAIEGTGILHAHPELRVTRVAGRRLTLTLLGDAFDWMHPTHDNDAILRRLDRDAESVAGLVEATRTLAGRWICIATGDEGAAIVRDACGLREVFYDTSDADGLWCASQPDAIARLRGLEKDPRAVAGFEQADYARTDDEHWWPGDATAWAEIRALLPNHVLDLPTGSAWRPAPSRIVRRELDDAAAEGAEILALLARSVTSRGPQTLPLTAGMDSRTLLAASRAHLDSLHVFTFTRPTMPSSHPDLRIPAQLSRRFGFAHRVARRPGKAEPGFAAAWFGNASPASMQACRIASALAPDYPAGHGSICSLGSEIARGGIHLLAGRPTPLDGAGLARMYGMGDNRFAADRFDEWLSSAWPYAVDAGIDVLDLSYWEQRVGRWAANAMTQWDTLFERHPLFSCRSLLDALLSVDEEHRDIRLHERMIELLWPELLELPVNPEPKPSIARRSLQQLSRGKKRLTKIGGASGAILLGDAAECARLLAFI